VTAPLLGSSKTAAKAAKAKRGLAWLAFALAIIGGVTATASWIGAAVAGAAGLFLWWVPLALMVAVGLLVVGDVLGDGIPNRRAIYGVILWPSLMLSVEGKLGHTLQGWITKTNAYLDRSLGGWITDAPRGSAAVLTAIAVMTITFAVVYAERYAKAAQGTRPGPALLPPAGRR
jgi:hypothetical protein